MKKHDEHLCAEIQSTLPLYVGGDLEAQALAEVRAHLADCAPCAERALAARAARRELVAALRIESRPGPDLWAGVRAALADEGVLRPAVSAPTGAPFGTKRPRWASWRVALAAAAVVAAFWIGSRWNGPDGAAERNGVDSPPVVFDPKPEAPRIPVVPVNLPADPAGALVAEPAPESGGLRRLQPGERQLRESAPQILQDRRAYLGAPLQPPGGAMQPVGLQRVDPNAPRWW